MSEVRPACYEYMTDAEYHDAVQQMLADLNRLAKQDGCIAAAWALVEREAMAERIRELEEALRQYADTTRWSMYDGERDSHDSVFENGKQDGFAIAVNALGWMQPCE